MSNTTGAHDPFVADYRATSPRCAQGGKLSGLPEALAGFGPALVAAEADIVELAVVQGREVPARAVAVMPQREGDEDAVADATITAIAGKGKEAKNAFHRRTVPPCEGSALR
jgi:hypothetical protein